MTDTTVLSDDDFVRLFQARAKLAGIFDGAIGGNAGPLTRAALDRILPPPAKAAAPAWIAIAMTMLGKHEVRNNAELRAFLKRDGKTLGDPASLPWCGDAAETCIRLGLPDEPFPGKLGENPYWALNWQYLGMRLEEPMLGSIAYKSRNGGGHVTFTVGRSQDGQTLFCLGGNQGDTFNISAYRASDFMGFRWPKTAPAPQPLPVMDGANLPRNVSEF